MASSRDTSSRTQLRAQVCLAGLLLGGLAAPAHGLKHVIFAYVDHFENPQPPCILEGAMRAWQEDWPALALRHVDGDGRHPVHDFFLMQEAAWPSTTWTCLDWALPRLNPICYSGFGEVNLHLHHQSAYNPAFHTDAYSDTLFASLMADTVAAYNAHGAMLTAEVVPRPAFSFIHGGWSLDASRPPTSPNPAHHLCWVKWELRYLRQFGCYADVTFPAYGVADANPLITDSIFYARDDAEAGSYKNPDNVRLVEVGQPPWGDLMMIEGPNGYTSIDPSSSSAYATLARMNEWVGHNVHVVGKDDWVFVKVYTHGASYGDLVPGSSSWNVFFGPPMDQFYSDIEAVYNDGVNWELHYVSAREMYNIARAAEAGLNGDPNEYRDYVIPPYANSLILSPSRYRLHSYSRNMVLLERLDSTAPMELGLRQFSPCSIVEECTKVDSWRWETSSSGCAPTDAVVNAGQFGELHLVDSTPSAYYRIRAAACPEPNADFDLDGDVDQGDFQTFALCSGGSGLPALPGCSLVPDAQGRLAADFDRDSDVDQEDFGAFQRCYSGPDVFQNDPTCY